MDTRYGLYWIIFVVWILTTVTYSAQTKSSAIKKYSSKHVHHTTTTFNEIFNGSTSLNRDKREIPSEFTIIKHKSRPSKRHPGYRSRRRPKPVYGPPNFSYGSPISDYTLGYTTSKGKKTKNNPTSTFSSSISDFSDTKYEDFISPLKINPYSGHNSYESSFKSGSPYASQGPLLPSFPLETYGSDSSSSYTPPPTNAYSNQGYKSFGEPPQTPKLHDATGLEPYESSQSVKTIPPSTNYGVPVAPIQTNFKTQPQKTQTSINQPQDTYIANLHNSFSTPIISQSQSQNYYNSPNLQTTFTSSGGYVNSGSSSNVGVYTNSGSSSNVGVQRNPGSSSNLEVYTNPGSNTNIGFHTNPGSNSNLGVYTNLGISTNAGINAANSINPNNIAASDPSVTNLLTKFNQNALNTLTFNSYAPSQPPQVKYVPGPVTITSSKELTVNRKPPSGKFAEPPTNYKNSYQTPIQHDPTKTTYNIDDPENQFQPSIYKPPQYESVSTTTERHKYLPPVLPTAYDQSEFNSFSNENDYSNYNQHSDFLDNDGDYSSLFDVSHESKKIPKTKLTKTYAGTKLKSEDSSSGESVEIPSDEYVDELISVSTTKKPRTRRRRPTAASTTPHILDTEDLRDAFSSGSVQYSLAVNPNEKISKGVVKSQSKTAKDKNFVLLSSANKNRTWNRQYPSRQQSSFDPINDVKEFFGTDFDSSEKTNSSNKGIEILSIQKSKSHSYYAGTVAPPQLSKQKGINARYDQPKYDDSMFNVVSTNVRMANKNHSNYKLAAGPTGSRRTKKQNFNDSTEGIEDETSKEIDPIFWNGRKLPENHKLAKRSR